MNAKQTKVAARVARMKKFYNAYKARYNAGERLKITVSEKNVKMNGKNPGEIVPSFSLAPLITCPPAAFDPVSGCAFKCYADAMTSPRPSIAKSWAKNTVLWEKEPERVKRELAGYLITENPEYFRYNVGGDIPPVHTETYVSMIFELAERFPETDFLIFTRRYKAISDHVAARGGTVPQNLHILFSAWDKPLPAAVNPYNFPQTVVLQPGTPVPRGGFTCGGCCFECGCRGVGCWVLKPGAVLYFFEH